MTNYKAPFHVRDSEGRYWYDGEGKPVPMADIAAMLNAHASQSAQRCETCRYVDRVNGDPYVFMRGYETVTLCAHPDMTGVRAIGHGCTAHQPKEDGK